MLVAFFISLATITSDFAAEAVNCRANTAAALSLSPGAFDQDESVGWRGLAKTPECLGAAADLIAAYRKAHWGEFRPSELHLNYWHEGQMRAAAGQTKAARPLLLEGISPDNFGDFADYALGTVAFLDQDLAALKAARARLAATPEPADFAATAKRYNITWPLNLDVLDGLITCFDKPYREAYACRISR
jgi:hypothetical protein